MPLVVTSSRQAKMPYSSCDSQPMPDFKMRRAKIMHFKVGQRSLPEFERRTVQTGSLLRRKSSNSPSKIANSLFISELESRLRPHYQLDNTSILAN
jgi:hypothetical protein